MSIQFFKATKRILWLFLSFFFENMLCIFVLMDSLTTYTNYFENIARQLNSISHTDGEPHFEVIYSAALFTGVQSKIDERVFFLEDYTIALVDNKGSLSKKTTGAFLILKKVSGSGDYKKITEAKAWAEIECNKVLAKILHDKKNSVAAVRGFDFGSVEMQPMDNQPSGWWGMRVEFGLNANTNFCFHQDDWNGTVPPVIPCKPLEEYTVAQLLIGLSETQLLGIMEAQDVRLLENGEILELE